MGPYKPKRFEIINYTRYSGRQRAVGVTLARELYGPTRDYYISIHLWWIGITIVFIRLTTPLSSSRGDALDKRG